MRIFNKEFYSNLVSFSSVELLTSLIPILTMPILTERLGGEVYGQYLLYVTILVFGHTFADYGLHFVGVRFVSINKTNRDKIKVYYSRAQGLRFIFVTVYSFFISLYLNVSFENFSIGNTIYIFIYLTGYVLSSAWFYQGVGKTYWLIGMTVITKVTLLLGIIFIVEDGNDFNLLIFFTSCPILLSGLFLYLNLKLQYKVKVLSIDVIQHFKDGWDVFLGLLMPNFYNSIPSIYLASIANPIDYAKYMIAIKICGLASKLLNIVSKSLFPLLSRLKSIDIRTVAFTNLCISIVCFLSILFFGDFFINYFLDDSVGGSNVYMTLISIGTIFLGVSNAFSQGYILPKGLFKEYRDISIKSSIISVFITIPLVVGWGLIGGALALTCARIIYSYQYYKGYKNDIKYNC